MKGLKINGSTRVKGKTCIALKEMEKMCAEEGEERETVRSGSKYNGGWSTGGNGGDMGE